MNRTETLRLLKKHQLQPTRSLGQNFLIDERALQRIVTAAELTPADLVLEIGPGIGALTRQLCQGAGKVVAIEIDRRLKPALTEATTDCLNMELIWQDARQVDFAALTAGWQGPVKFCANLPYFITSELLLQILTQLPAAQTVLLMMQREAAERFLTDTGQREVGPIAILLALLGKAERVFQLSAASFHPRPAVGSTVLRLRPRQAATRLEAELGGELAARLPQFAAFLRQGFVNRRKTLVNSLMQQATFRAKQDRGQVLQLLTARGYSERVRAEEIDPRDWIHLYRLFYA